MNISVNLLASHFILLSYLNCLDQGTIGVRINKKSKIIYNPKQNQKKENDVKCLNECKENSQIHNCCEKKKARELDTVNASAKKNAFHFEN